jgi:glycine/D-amino acid oxidase-like deaminating enzyme
MRFDCNAESEWVLSDGELTRLLTEDAEGEAACGRLIELRADAVVITAGAWSDNVQRLFGLKNYSEAVRRQICIVDNRATNLADYGMIVDTSGLYFHHEGTHILAGYSPPETPPGHHFEYEGEKFFEEEIWPRMYVRMSCCERLRHVTGWAGLYELSPDRSAIIGRAKPRVYEAHSFSGRGAMESYGAGQAIAELIATGSYDEFDASGLERSRFENGELLQEELYIYRRRRRE